MDYSDLEWCATLVLSELGLATEPHDLRASLEANAGKLPDGVTVVYRPYRYCAQHLDRTAALSTGKGGSTFRFAERVRAYLVMQGDLDKALQLTVPPGTEIVTAQPLRGFTGSVPTTVVF